MAPEAPHAPRFGMVPEKLLAPPGIVVVDADGAPRFGMVPEELLAPPGVTLVEGSGAPRFCMSARARVTAA